MPSGLRGDLSDNSISLSEIITAYRQLSGKAADFVYDKMFGKALSLAGLDGEIPSEVNDGAKEWILVLAKLYFPDTAKKVEQYIDDLGTAVAKIGRDAAKLKMVSDAAGENFLENNIRLVNSRYTFEEARRYYRWSGTLCELRLGSILTGPADPKKYFTIFAPGRKMVVKSTFHMTVCDTTYQ